MDVPESARVWTVTGTRPTVMGEPHQCEMSPELAQALARKWRKGGHGKGSATYIFIEPVGFGNFAPGEMSFAVKAGEQSKAGGRRWRGAVECPPTQPPKHEECLASHSGNLMPCHRKPSNVTAAPIWNHAAFNAEDFLARAWLTDARLDGVARLSPETRYTRARRCCFGGRADHSQADS